MPPHPIGSRPAAQPASHVAHAPAATGISPTMTHARATLALVHRYGHARTPLAHRSPPWCWQTIWFNLPIRDRRRISVLLNVAYIMHFVSQAFHLVYYTYVEGQTWPGAFAQNVPFVLSIFATVAAGILQERCENVLIAKYPDLYPPRIQVYLWRAWQKWITAEVQGGLLTILRAELADYKSDVVRAKSRGLQQKGGIIAGLRGYADNDISGRSPTPKSKVRSSRSSRSLTGLSPYRKSGNAGIHDEPPAPVCVSMSV